MMLYRIYILIIVTTCLVGTVSGQSMEWLCHPGEYVQVTYIGHDMFKVKNDQNKSGIIHVDGREILEIKYDSITPFEENKALLLGQDGTTLLGILSSKGELIKDFSGLNYKVTRYPKYKENRLPFTNASGLSGYLNEKGEISIEPVFYFVAPFQDGIAAVQYQTGDYGLINKGGKSAIISNTKYSFVSSPVDEYVLTVTNSSKGGNVLRLCKIDNQKLKTERTLENGMFIWLSDDFTTVECQRGGRYYIDDQWRISGSNTDNKLPEVKESVQPFYTDTSKILGKTASEGGYQITYLGNPILYNVFPNVTTTDNYAIVHSRDGKVGVLKLNKTANINIKTPQSPIPFYHNHPIDLLLDVDLSGVDADKIHWYRNEAGYLTHSALEFNDGKYQLRMPYYSQNTISGGKEIETIDIAFTYDGLDWMHQNLDLKSEYKTEARFEVALNGSNVVDGNDKTTLTIDIRSLNGPAKGRVIVPGLKPVYIEGETLSIPINETVFQNTSKTFTFNIKIEEDGFPDYSTVISKTVQGRVVDRKESGKKKEPEKKKEKIRLK